MAMEFAETASQTLMTPARPFGRQEFFVVHRAGPPSTEDFCVVHVALYRSRYDALIAA
jgi:hypothetical protein